jgi:hypothetical protein
MPNDVSEYDPLDHAILNQRLPIVGLPLIRAAAVVSSHFF